MSRLDFLDSSHLQFVILTLSATEGEGSAVCQQRQNPEVLGGFIAAISPLVWGRAPREPALSEPKGPSRAKLGSRRKAGRLCDLLSRGRGKTVASAFRCVGDTVVAGIV